MKNPNLQLINEPLSLYEKTIQETDFVVTYSL